MTTRIDAAELRSRLDKGEPLAVIDVLPEEFFIEQHLPGARRAGVYEVTFLDQIKQLGLQADTPVVLYGAGQGSLDSSVAAEKLERAGFTQLFNFEGGREAWLEAGGKLEGKGTQPMARPSQQPHTYRVAVEDSSVEWIGRNLNSTHRGTLRVAQGDLTLKAGLVQSGRIVFAMGTIENANLSDLTLRGVLENHLKSDDFFDVERFPTAELRIRSAESVPDATPGSPNQIISADLTIKDATHLIEFPAIVAAGADGSVITIAQLEIDRTRWNVLYGSGSVFRLLGKHLVNDHITVLVKVVAR
jgi:rhodanese-related sulfurtransferase/polyisoprenoid-binding protein YceI